MTLVLLSFIVVCLAVCGLSVGVMLGRKPLQGSCGGIAELAGSEDCELCGGNPEKCEEQINKNPVPARSKSEDH